MTRKVIITHFSSFPRERGKIRECKAAQAAFVALDCGVKSGNDEESTALRHA
jgi:hypothetical protein